MKNILFALWLKKLKPVKLMCVTSQFLNFNIHKYLPIGIFKYSWKSQELHLEKFI